MMTLTIREIELHLCWLQNEFNIELGFISALSFSKSTFFQDNFPTIFKDNYFLSGVLHLRMLYIFSSLDGAKTYPFPDWENNAGVFIFSIT